MSDRAIEALLLEGRRFAPPEAFRRQAVVQDPRIYDEAERDPEGFWAGIARELHWFTPWTAVLEWTLPYARWFVGGTTNIAYNCLDRHLAGPRRTKAAIIWEGEPGEERVLTYGDLYREVCKFANVLKGLGVRSGDRVAIYLPMIPELPVAMLACARIGAGFTVVFGGFSAEALRDRINDARAKVLVTADGGWRRGQVVPLKRNADEALEGAPSVQHVVIVRRIGEAAAIHVREGRDHWWHRLMADAPLRCEAEAVDSEHLLYILYTSGTTGKPKGIMHTTGGYMVGTYATTRWVFDLREEDVYWCTADIGWVTGHSYIVFGPLLNGASVVMYEGTPDYPEKDRFWTIVEKHGVNILYTAPTAIRTFMKWGPEYPRRRDLSSLRLLGTVGEPINPEAWVWYYKHIGGERCPVVDTWWQTETGMILISPLPGLTTLKPGSATRPLPGIAAEIVNDRGQPVGPNQGGYLVLTRPWPAMLRGIYGDPDRYQQQYWSRFPGMYFTGDGAKRDEDGYFWLLGRVDDVINVAGHRIGTYEVESALVDHPSVAEAAVIGVSHDIKGQAIAAFVTLKEGHRPGPEAVDTLKQHVVNKIGALARPEQILFTSELPKTRSGKIMRRLLRDIAEGRVLGDTTTLADPAVVEALKERYEEEGAG
ncbi:MAG: acetate--CoA ligase [Armatimonadota bacterium]|nr:acetate--CoA ligase [Armatimonadota bacterium]MDR7452429.1 acetate--CoA ligase [Armatimonadota bacterium]MDR7468080.1 acetate--CoA ligase [Armatimonadota bacterium]MDR7494650.1 acetate--CoA ligase [Armatimonadota bacterium]MDR7500217.1 acetate--CoA ligase [Armatimonadota bacterium]